MTTLALGTLALWLALTVDWLLGLRHVERLELSPDSETSYPTLTVVIPALNEAAALGASLNSVLTQDYPNLQVIVLNDRSTDATGAILEQLQRSYPRLQVVHITELPPGWLGKNHALQEGVRRTAGDWLLFTDADVQFAPGTLRAAVSHALKHDLGHLTAIPRLTAKSPWLRSFVASFTLLFSYSILRFSGRFENAYLGAHVGIGAFNLVQRPVYEAVGGHQKIALRPDDDMMLGKLIKRAGFRQGAVLAADLIQVEWYESVRGAVAGLNKNAFAGLSYSLTLVLLVTATLLLTHVWPFAAVFLTTGAAQVGYALVLFTIVLVYAVGGRLTKLPLEYALLHPLGTTILVYAILEAAVKATVQGGIRWRGTFYALGELKKNKV